MKAGEVKLKLINSGINMIDTYFSGTALNEKFINSTLKIILKQNISKIDNILQLFSDKNGEIDTNEIMNEYANMIDDSGFIFDLKNYINNDMVKNFIPDKVLVIKREDILNLLK
jgi:hypothetical protein